MKRSLDIAMDGEIVATIAEPRTNKFTITYVKTASDDQSLSVRLPADPERYSPGRVAGYISGLMPGLERREELAEIHEVPSHLVFRFLEILGADLPGGAVFVATDAALPDDTMTPTGRPLTEADLTDEINAIRIGDEWAVPGPGVPSTHVLRVEDERLPNSAAAEALVLRTAAAAGLPACDAELTTVLGLPALAVTRADRTVTEAGIKRRHLENFAQVCGIDSITFPDSLYQEMDGPGFLEMAEAIDTNLPQPKGALEHLCQLMVFHAVMGNTNAHAGTYSLLLPERQIGPLDTALPAELYTEFETAEGVLELDHRLAMSIHDFWKTDALDHEDFVREGSSWPGLTREASIGAVDFILAALVGALETAAAATPEAPTALVEMALARIDQYRSPGSAS